jgi:hypothetical protein
MGAVPWCIEASGAWPRITSAFDVTTDGRPIKIVSIIDEHTRECLGAGW